MGYNVTITEETTDVSVQSPSFPITVYYDIVSVEGATGLHLQ